MEYSIYDSFGSIIGGSFTALDITERKNIEIVLKQNEERFKLVSKATFDAIWDWDIEKNTLFRGEGYYKLFGVNASVNVQAGKVNAGCKFLGAVY